MKKQASLLPGLYLASPYEHARAKLGGDVLYLSLLVNTNMYGFTDAVLSSASTWLPSALNNSHQYVASRPYDGARTHRLVTGLTSNTYLVVSTLR